MTETRTNAALNILRVAAAVVVCIGHVRGTFLVTKEDAGGGTMTELAYALTSLGNGAVLVFFVLSGYFVGGSVIRQRCTFNWGSYLASRMIRLWLVLIPALVLTTIMDWIGTTYFARGQFYGATSPAETHSTPLIWIGNAFFQQTQLVPAYGSNGALWSLGYEFTYYILFPLILIGVGRRRKAWLGRLISALLVVGLSALAGPWVLILFVGWLLGAGVAWQNHRIMAWLQRQSAALLFCLRLAAMICLVAAMALDKLQGGGPRYTPLGTFLTMVFAAALVAVLVSDVRPRFRATRTVVEGTSRLAESSYSLYAYHVPVLYLAATIITPVGSTAVFEPNAFGWGLVLATTAGLILGGWLFARVTEHYYRPIRSRILSLIRPSVKPDGLNSKLNSGT